MQLGERIVIIGASGSGKTTLAKTLGARLGCDAIGLDRIHWNGKVTVPRDESEAVRMVVDAAAAPSWIIEGVFGWLAAPALPRASAVIWLDLPWAVCSEGLAQRGRWAGATDDEHAGFLQWAADYWTRQTPSSFVGHQKIFDRFDGFKVRLQSRSEIAAFVGEGSCHRARVPE